jgi:hypothetical protein
MATGLSESSDSSSEQRPDDVDGRYRAIAGAAIAAAVAALLSPLAFFDWWLAIVPILGIVLGVLAVRTIAVRPDEYIGRPLAIGAIVVSVLSLVGGLAWLSRVYAAELPEGYERLNYAMLQPQEDDLPGTVPKAALAINGHKVLLKGYMYPGKQQTNIVQFLLVRDQGDCCFGGNPKITDRVLVQLRDPNNRRGISFTPRLIKIAGTFAVRPAGTAVLDGGVLYHLEEAFAR